jgi:cytochrome c biogenesis protein CcdA
MTNFFQITGLALADSVNPCEIALLAMVLTTILIQNPEKKKKVLYAGFAFVLAVFLGYLAYGLILVQVFNSVAEFMRQYSHIIYNVLAIISMLLGALNIKDYFYYKKGSFATEMPIFLRPRAKRIIDKMTSAWGAFILGFVVTLFLLPCTAGPLIVASGLLSNLGLLGAMPWLLYYDLVFVLPMIIIVLIVYFGFAKVDEVSGWKERNIKRLHLISGVLLFLVGLAILMRWI